ncbi:MAG TPA: DUF1565 domain-containing protein, partial [Phycisphaerales bacterium]|nr:DUF1565 domain-containing protein [Phycisphaerales bacterium]
MSSSSQRSQFRFFSAAAALVALAGIACGQVYVAPSGHDAATGTANDPVKTIARGLELAAPMAVPVYVAGGTYVETVELISNVDILGGFDRASGWARDPDLYQTVIQGTGGSAPAMYADFIADVTVDGVTVTNSDATVPGESSLAVLVIDSIRVVFNDCRVEAGAGADGAPGARGAQGWYGSNGDLGLGGCEDGGVFCESCAQPAGGWGGWGADGNDGGRGGAPGRDTGNGSHGEPGEGDNGGAGGTGTPAGMGDWNPSSAHVGKDGGDGAPGAAGLGGRGRGDFYAWGYDSASAAGAAGAQGEHGSGGGGGGGGGGGTVSCVSYGARGGG